MSGRYYAADADKTRLGSSYGAFERMVSYFARLQPDEGRRKVVRPAAKGSIYLREFCRPRHWQTLWVRAEAGKRML